MLDKLRKLAETQDNISVTDLKPSGLIHPDKPRLCALWSGVCDACKPSNAGHQLAVITMPSDRDDQAVLGIMVYAPTVEPPPFTMASLEIRADSTPLSLYNELIAQMAEMYIHMLTDAVEGRLSIQSVGD